MDEIIMAILTIAIGLGRVLWMFATRDTKPNEEFAPPLIPKPPERTGRPGA
ncbi:MAG: hypothetical protein RL318_846 [Fibrobacterota bacterium]|jgi:hypothetical protein